MMRAMLLALWLVAFAAAGEEEQIICFDANANRLSQDYSGALSELKARLGAAPGGRLVMLAPRAADPRWKRLIIARRTVLDQVLAAQGMAAEHEEDGAVPFEGNYLLLSLRRQSSAAAAPPAEQPAWTAETGRTLRAVLQDWAAQAGWSLVWQSAYDYPLEASARLGGDFPSAAVTLLKGFSEAQPPPTARLFRGNNVLIIQ